MEEWREVLFRLGWGRRTRPQPGDGLRLERERSNLRRYRELRDSGLEALGVSNYQVAIEHLAGAAIFCRGLPEAHINLATAFAAAGRIEAARQTLEIGLHYARRWRTAQAVVELGTRLNAMPPPPPTRTDFHDGHDIYSSLTNSRWTVLEHSVGGMGVVYKVRDHADGQIRGLKTLQAKFVWSAGDRERFVREAATWVRLDPHPNVICAEWVESIEDFPCVVMEWMEGGDLGSLLAAQPLRPERALELAIQFCDGMAFAHRSLGIVHRDVKPDNCLLTSKGVLKIGDFGLARGFAEGRLEAFESSGLPSDAQVRLTSPYGTEPYMAPEQHDPEAVLDARTDVHGFGVLLYEMLTRNVANDPMRPFDRDDIGASLKHHRIPSRLRDLVVACTTIEPSGRPAGFDEVRIALTQVLQKSYRRQPPVSPVALPVDARYWNNKAIAFQALDSYDDAIACYEQALTLTPNDSDLWQNKGVALLCKRQYAQAIAAFDRALHLAPDDAEILSNKGLAHLRLGQRDEAIDCFRKAAHGSPGDPIICKNLAEALCQSGQAEEGLDWVRKGLLFDGRNPALLGLQGFGLLAVGRVDEAVRSFDYALSISPRGLELWKGKAIAHTRRGEPSEALDACNKALEVSPEDVATWRHKVETLVTLGQLELGALAVDRLLQLAADDAIGLELEAHIRSRRSSAASIDADSSADGAAPAS